MFMIFQKWKFIKQGRSAVIKPIYRCLSRNPYTGDLYFSDNRDIPHLMSLDQAVTVMKQFSDVLYREYKPGQMSIETDDVVIFIEEAKPEFFSQASLSVDGCLTMVVTVAGGIKLIFSNGQIFYRDADTMEWYNTEDTIEDPSVVSILDESVRRMGRIVNEEINGG